MKEIKFISALISLVILCLILKLKNNDVALKTGDISFTSFKSDNNDSFSIITFVDLPSRTKIHFTDSEWDGNHFGFDENDLLWKTGNINIPAGSIISFTNLNSNPFVTNGTVSGTMNLSKNGDAIFAYLGNTRMPVKFLAAVANDELSYGTLLNTNLVNGKTAITFPKGTLFAVYKGPHSHQNTSEHRSALNKMCNYTFKQFR